MLTFSKLFFYFPKKSHEQIFVSKHIINYIQIVWVLCWRSHYGKYVNNKSLVVFITSIIKLCHFSENDVLEFWASCFCCFFTTIPFVKAQRLFRSYLTNGRHGNVHCRKTVTKWVSLFILRQQHKIKLSKIVRKLENITRVRGSITRSLRGVCWEEIIGTLYIYILYVYYCSYLVKE